MDDGSAAEFLTTLAPQFPVELLHAYLYFGVGRVQKGFQNSNASLMLSLGRNGSNADN